MRHAVYLFIGEELKECAAKVEQYVSDTENKTINDHFSTLLWILGSDRTATILQADGKRQEADNSHDQQSVVEWTKSKTVSDASGGNEIKAFFMNFYQGHVVIGSEGSGSDLLLTIVCPAFDATLYEEVLRIIKTLDIQGFHCAIDILLLAPDLAKVFMSDKERIEAVDNNVLELNKVAGVNAKDLIKQRAQHSVLHHILLIQNCNEKGIALNLDLPTLARILAEYVVTMVENYHMIYNQGVELTHQDDIASFGLSCLYFDRQYFIHYLLHHAYLKIMEDEKVMQAKVDINKVSSIANKCLLGREHVASDFYNKYVDPQLAEGKTPETIVNDIRPKLDEFISELEKQMLSYIPDDELSLPEKRAVLAQILVIDDELLSGTLYDKRRLTFLDILKEPIEYFVNANNVNMTFKVDENGKQKYNDFGCPEVEHTVLRRPVGSNGHIVVPIDRLKTLRIKIREASEYIREKEEELKKIERLEDEEAKSKIIVADDKTDFDTLHYHLLNEVNERPLAEDYAPETATTEKSIDLASDFTAVKDQGEIGSCSVFAVTSVFEYILKKSHHANYDLSERFVYYNVRKANNELYSEGSAISDVINNIGKDGICLEEKCPYDKEHYNDKPADEAYEDAIQRTIVKALNIPITEDIDRNVNLIKTAIAEGYPVVFGLKIYESFHKSKGFITMPDENSKEDGAHAMVVCGFDDDSMLFKVRNSWGTRFGKDGYCFIPYAYIGQKQYVSSAYIITAISTADVVKGITSKHSISFDQTDNIIKQAIISSLIANKRVSQKQMEESYRTEFADFVFLNQTLCDQTVRDRIKVDEENRLKEEQRNAKEIVGGLEASKGDKLQEYESQTRSTLMYMGLAGLILLLAILICVFGFDYYGYVVWLLGGFWGINILVMIGYYHNQQKEYKRYKTVLDDEIANQAAIVGRYDKQLAELKVRMYVYGMVLDSLSHLHNNLTSFSNSLKSYVNNLAVWYKHEKDRISEMSSDEHVPFIALCDNNILDDFFAQHAGELTDGIKLHQYMHQGNYSLDEESILKFKQGLRDLIEERLRMHIDGFTMYDYVNNVKPFPYLRNDYSSLESLLQKTLQPYSQVLLSLANPSVPFMDIFVKYNEDMSVIWLNQCKRLCGGSPSCGVTNSSDKLLVLQLEYVSLSNVAIFSNAI